MSDPKKSSRPARVPLSDYAGMENFILRAPRRGRPNAVVYKDSGGNVVVYTLSDYDGPKSIGRPLTLSKREAVRMGAALLWAGGMDGVDMRVTVLPPPPKNRRKK